MTPIKKSPPAPPPMRVGYGGGRDSLTGLVTLLIVCSVAFGFLSGWVARGGA